MLLKEITGALNHYKSKNSMMIVVSSRDNGIIHKIFDLVKMLTHSSIYVIV